MLGRSSAAGSRSGGTSWGGLSVRIVLLALLAFWLCAMLLFNPLDHEPIGKDAFLRGSSAKGRAPSQPQDTLSGLAAVHREGADLHEMNLAHEKELSGHNVAFSMTPGDAFHTNHLIIVAGHAVVRLAELSHAAKDDASWWLLKYQRGQGFPAIISSHVKKGIDLAAADEQSLLMFSGGQTRKDVGPTSEAASYYYLADTQGWIPAAGDAVASSAARTVRDRLFLEEFARDSYENLLFSLCRHREVTGAYPEKVTVVGFDFKEERFVEEHRAAIGFPAKDFHYVGLQPPDGSGFDRRAAAAGEESVVAAYSTDPYGCKHSLADKRQLRNPFRRSIPYEEACPELHALVQWCGPEPFDGQLPWQTSP
eukprot:GSChrysophyteH1.ASY1.ANO1.1380.1 assembled CDS